MADGRLCAGNAGGVATQAYFFDLEVAKRNYYKEVKKVHNQRLSKRSVAQVKKAIVSARTFAEEHKVPLTAERLAAALDMDIGMFRTVVEGRYTEEGIEPTLLSAKISAIQSAFSEATASVMEHAMQRGTSPNMHMLYLKENAGYGEKEGAAPTVTAPVIFLGEEEIPE